MTLKYVPEGLTLIFEGKQRSGKTLSLVAWTLDAFQNGRNVFSNFQLGFPHTPLSFEDAKLEDGSSKFWNSFIALDEWNFLFDGRLSMKQRNIEHSAFLLQQKKQGATIGGTTHDLQSLDVRLRMNYDYLITPRVYPAYPEVPQILQMRIENGPLQKRFKRTLTLDCRPLLGLYDTFAIYNPFTADKKKTKPESRARLSL